MNSNVFKPEQFNHLSLYGTFNGHDSQFSYNQLCLVALAIIDTKLFKKL